MSNQTDQFSRNQILKAGVLIAGSVASSLMLTNKSAQAQSSSGQFNEVQVSSAGDFNNPQVAITQTTKGEFSRLRFFNRRSPGLLNFHLWDIATTSGQINFFDQNNGNVMILRSSGDLSITGTLTQGSSRTLKENITQLSSKEALEALSNLNPVKFRYKADIDKVNHVGFIAEEVPELVATPNRKGLSAMDIVGVLTRAVQEQQKTILALTEKVAALETRN